jgi:type IV fimbrial biogenesis protein FimT
MNRPTNHVRGFSLIELMMGIALMAILVAFAVPSFSEMRAKVQIRGAAEAIVSAVGNARSEAVRLDRFVRTVFLTNSGGGWCVGSTALPNATSTASCDCFTANSCQLNGVETRVVGNMPAVANNFVGVTWTDVGFGAGGSDSFVTFDPKRAIQTVLATGNITLHSPDDRFQLGVSVTPLGRAQVCTPSDSASPVPGYQAC